ncbi:transporter MFS superfamily [Vibrio ponticus]|nr:transporter MFS superfamily [Vibrio ponticus]
MLAGCLLPIILQQSISAAWLLLAAITFLTTFITWSTWKTTDANTSFGLSSAKLNTLSKAQQRTLTLLVLAYGLDAIGYLPHTLFWVDFIVRDLDRSLTFGGAMWAIFGVGAALGPILVGAIGDKLNLKFALCGVLLCKAFGVFLPTITTSQLV